MFTPITFLTVKITGLFRWISAHEDRRWAPAPAGCCACGTGGPYYTGAAPQVTRYLYGGATVGSDASQYHWTSCSRHPLTGLAPVVDYGHDVIVTYAQTEQDFNAARPAQGTPR